QLSTYTDMFRRGIWTIPEKIVTKELTEGALAIAEGFCRTHEVTPEEVELWIRYLRPVWGLSAEDRQMGLIAWDEEMRRPGLLKDGGMTMHKFVHEGFQHDKQG